MLFRSFFDRPEHPRGPRDTGLASVFVGLPQMLAFVVTAALLIVWDVHPFLALGAGALISLAGRWLSRTGTGSPS